MFHSHPLRFGTTPDDARTALLLAMTAAGIVGAWLVVAPAPQLVGGFELDRIEDQLHAGATALVVLGVAALRRRRRLAATLAAAVAAALAVSVAAELVQMTVPGRSPSAADIGYDAVGIAFGSAVVAVVGWRIDLGAFRRAVAVLLASGAALGVVLVAPASI